MLYNITHSTHYTHSLYSTIHLVHIVHIYIYIYTCSTHMLYLGMSKVGKVGMNSLVGGVYG